MHDSVEYFRMRAADERKRSLQADNSRAAAAHAELADRYEEMADRFEAGRDHEER